MKVTNPAEGHRKRLRERFHNTGLEAFAPHEVTHSRGAADKTSVFPGEVVRSALKLNAYAIAFAHNDPSGVPSPSDADKLLTKQLVLAATAAQIKIVDHLIVTADQVFSFRKEGLL